MTQIPHRIHFDQRPARNGWAPGDYHCKCSHCDKIFGGAKRCWTCADCAYGDDKEQP